MRSLCLLLVLASGTAAAEDRLGDRTHVLLAPTGATLPAGQVQVSVHELGMWNDVAVGATDWLELSLDGMLFPVPIYATHAKVRLTPRAWPLRVAAGIGAGRALTPDSPGIFGEGTVTVAYQAQRVNVHGSITYLSVGDGELGNLNAGVAFTASTSIALSIDLHRLSTRQDGDVAQQSFAIVGVKGMMKHWDIDVGFLLGTVGVDDADVRYPIAVPVFSVAWRP